MARTQAPRSRHRDPVIGTCYLHTVIDDHSRVAYVEAHHDETKETATEVLRNAVAWFADRGVTVQRVLSDNGSAYKSHLWHQTCIELDIAVKKTLPYRPQTNGKIERFHRTLAEGWAFKKFYSSESARLAALPAWVHEYNHHRPHSAIGKCSPISRLDNLAGQRRPTRIVVSPAFTGGRHPEARHRQLRGGERVGYPPRPPVGLCPGARPVATVPKHLGWRP